MGSENTSNLHWPPRTDSVRAGGSRQSRPAWTSGDSSFKPFASLKGVVETAQVVPNAAVPAESVRKSEVVRVPPGVPDDELFEYAMKDVKALGWSLVPLHHRPPMEIQPQNDEEQALKALEAFLRDGDVDLEQTPEYIEGSVDPTGPLYLKTLRSGGFSVQSHLDLHGMNQQEARFALDEFLMESLRSRYRCVRVIHGRGLHSHKKHPILKDSIQRWLCSRRLGRHIIAYTSARSCDGGGGALYVLLRKA